MTTPNWLDTLEEKWEQRMKRYRDKKTRAEGTDIVNQGAKVKATAECLDEFRAGRRNAGLEPVACEKLREAAMDVMIPLAAWKLNDEQEQYREIGPTMRAALIAAHDKLLAALFLPCSCGTKG